MKRTLLMSLAGWTLAISTLAAAPVQAAGFCPGDGKKPSVCPGDDKKPSACPGDDKTPSACPGDDKKQPPPSAHAL